MQGFHIYLHKNIKVILFGQIVQLHFILQIFQIFRIQVSQYLQWKGNHQLRSAYTTQNYIYNQEFLVTYHSQNVECIQKLFSKWVSLTF